MAAPFAERVLDDATAMLAVVMASIGDRLGLWKDLAANGPATSRELARRMGLSERHVREWLAAMAAAHYLDFDPRTTRYELTADHAAALADEDGPAFLGGVPQALVAYLQPYERIVETFRTGGGVPQSSYPPAAYEGQERFSATRFEHALVPVWLPAAKLDARLEAGIDVCDIGCGGGRAVLKLAQTYPRSRFVGYDVYGPNVQRARSAAARAGLGDRVTFAQVDGATPLPSTFDAIMMFDVLHDAVEPRALLASVRRALRDGGSVLCLEARSTPARAAFLHGVSVLYSLSTSLAHGGAGLGTCGLDEASLRELAGAAGFDRVDCVPIDDPFHQLYVLA